MLRCVKFLSNLRYNCCGSIVHLNVRHGSNSAIDKDKAVKIACASGFWGDTATAVPQLLFGSKIDFLILDYLSEITMSLLAAARQKAPEMGYTPDFVQFGVGPYLKELQKKGVRVVTNAGGINPQKCVEAIHQEAKKANVDLKVVFVTGDDLMPKRTELLDHSITDMKTGQPLPHNITTMNAYLGAVPIAKALDSGADVVITGRCTDSALCLGPLMHTFRWPQNDWDKLAAGSLAGHLIECGTQVTGGIFTDWHCVPQWENGGFPIATCYENGNVIISKPSGTGGLISWASVAEQLVYEIDDPENYILPDVVCDFSNVKISEVEGGVLVTGARGKPCPFTVKVSATFADGYRCIAVFCVNGPKAAEKAKKVNDAIIKRCQMIFKKLNLSDFTRTHIQLLGTESIYGPHASSYSKESREVVSWVGVEHSNKAALQIFARELASAGTGMAPGLTALVGGRPKPSPVLKLFSFLYPKEKLEIKIHNLDGVMMDYKDLTFDVKPGGTSQAASNVGVNDVVLPLGKHTYRLEDLAYTRSGDKGNTCNIGIIARHSSYYPFLKEYLTSIAVKSYFSHLLDDNAEVTRYELPGIHGLNFVLQNSLGGGGVASLRSDPQGKGYAQMLLDFQIINMPDITSLTK